MKLRHTKTELRSGEREGNTAQKQGYEVPNSNATTAPKTQWRRAKLYDTREPKTEQ
jgi:hypothetical protein